jgi:hypothetical protein
MAANGEALVGAPGQRFRRRCRKASRDTWQEFLRDPALLERSDV